MTSADSRIRTMDTSPPAVRPSHKLLQKFAPLRWRHPRHARSQDGLNTDLKSADNITYQLPPAAHFRALSLAPNPIQEGSAESLVLAALTSTSASEVPPYTPMPVPERVSSAKNIKDLQHHTSRVSNAKRDSAIYRLFPKEETDAQRDNLLDQIRGTNGVQNDIAHGTGPAFEDDLLLPHHSDTFRGRTKDMPSRVSKESSSATTSRPRGRSRGERSLTISPVASTPVTETESVTGPTITSPTEVPVFPQPDRIQSPVGSILVNIPAAPTKLSHDVVAHLQDPSPDKVDILNTDLNDVDDPNSWDLINREAKPIEERDASQFWLEKRAEQLYSAEHLHLVLNDSKYYSKFLGFMRKYRPWRVSILTYYSEAYKAMKAQEYANSLTVLLAGKSPLPNGNAHQPGAIENTRLHDAAREAFAELLKDDLHYFIAHTYIKIVSALVARRITGTLPAHLDEASGRLAEVFCITDCRLRDDPLILASEGFTRHSGGSLEYVLGRNCRFMQGPGTTVDSCRRFAISCQEQRDHTEIFVNYRRDGTPFLSLVMNAPLIDSQGNVRYFLGAQVDVSALLKECAGIESLSELVARQDTQKAPRGETPQLDSREQMKSLCGMFSGAELDIIRRHGGSAQRGRFLDTRTTRAPDRESRVLLADGSEDSDDAAEVEPSVHESITSGHALGSMDGTPGNLSGVYKYYLLVRPAPSLRVLFASPTMRVPGILQSPLLHRICRKGRVRDNLEDALREGKGVTARVRWLNKPSEEGEGAGVTRWLHCTPLIHHTGQVGLWMIVLVRPDVGGASLHTNTTSRRGSGSASRQPDLSSSANSVRNAEISFD